MFLGLRLFNLATSICFGRQLSSICWTRFNNPLFFQRFYPYILVHFLLDTPLSGLDNSSLDDELITPFLCTAFDRKFHSEKRVASFEWERKHGLIWIDRISPASEDVIG